MRALTAVADRLRRWLSWAYARAHPVRWLRWLRVGMLVMIVTAGVLCALVTSRAHQEIATASTQGAQALTEVGEAGQNLTKANIAVQQSFSTADVLLVGPGSAYEDDIAAASQDLVLAAENNVDGSQGAGDIQFCERLLIIYGGLVQQAVADFAEFGPDLANADLIDATSFAASVEASLETSKQADTSLRGYEQAAVTADLGSAWLSPGFFWWLLLAPFLAMLLLTAGTSYVLWHGFRRLLSVRLMTALGLTLGLVALVASLNVHDGGHAGIFLRDALSANATPPVSADAGFAYSAWTFLAAAVLAFCAAFLAFVSYRPRIQEYRYQP